MTPRPITDIWDEWQSAKRDLAQMTKDRDECLARLRKEQEQNKAIEKDLAEATRLHKAAVDAITASANLSFQDLQQAREAAEQHVRDLAGSFGDLAQRYAEVTAERDRQSITIARLKARILDLQDAQSAAA